ncbi:MAG: hypothetical protein QOF89_3817 [Acidobacteriota bacterium]|jgi:hypothetical protein|nr:hypothetical protein [Acidobacteriota bacterium]
MATPALRLGGGIAILSAFLTLSPLAADEQTGTFFDPGEVVGFKPVDAIAPEQVRQIRAAIAVYEKRKAASGAIRKDEGPFLYPFFPQAGILGKDLFISNFTDQNPSRGDSAILDWDCSDYTYDGHQGHDSLIRSFREQAIGVPVFAVLDGVVVDTHDGEPDMNTVWDERNMANYVVIDHGSGYVAWYFHFKQGSVAVSPGDTVTAGTQIGLTGSSGFSNWPHLHFQTEKDGHWIEPSAGPCRTGESLWASQPPVGRDFYVADFYLAHGAISIPDRESRVLDETERKATFVTGLQPVGVRIDVRNLPPNASYHLRVLNPRGKLVYDISSSFSNNELFLLAFLTPRLILNLDIPGTWRFQVAINDSLAVDAPFKVVTTASQIANRPPNKITTRLSPSHPVEGQVLTCTVQTSLVTEDPDYDIVSYHYEWKVNGRVVRTVTSAALTDLLAAGKAHPKDRVSCRVTPSDGKKAGPASVVSGIVAEP